MFLRISQQGSFCEIRMGSINLIVVKFLYPVGCLVDLENICPIILETYGRNTNGKPKRKISKGKTGMGSI